MAGEMFVKVATLGGEVKNVCLEEGATVADALEAAEMDVDGGEVKVNKRVVTVEDKVFDGDIVVKVPKINGG